MIRVIFFILGITFLAIFLSPFFSTIAAWKSEIAVALISSGMLAKISITAIFTTVSVTGYLSIRALLHT